MSAQGPQSPAFRVRCLLPAPALSRLGVNVHPIPLFSSAGARAFAGASARNRLGILLRARERMRAELRTVPETIDVAFVQRQVDMLPHLALERAALRKRRLIYDVDDAIWHDSAGAGGHALALLKGSRRKVDWLARRADHVVVGNDILAEYLAPKSRRLTVVPSLVDDEEVPIRRHDEVSRLVLGWIGSPTTAPYLERAAAGIAHLARNSARPVCLLVVGGTPPRIPGVEVKVLPWSEATEREALVRIDIGLMPLPDTPWTRGKCAYKALQYMASGIPCVADDVGISAQVIENGNAGRIARGSTGWYDALRELSASVELRQCLGHNGRTRVATDFSVRRWAPTLAAILKGEANTDPVPSGRHNSPEA